jgi:hypothetical protein
VKSNFPKKIPVSAEISLSLILFNVITDEIIKEAKAAGKRYMGNKEVKIVRNSPIDAVVIFG